MRKLEEGLIPLLPNEGWEGEEGKGSLARAVNFNSKSHERRSAAPEERESGRFGPSSPSSFSIASRNNTSSSSSSSSPRAKSEESRVETSRPFFLPGTFPPPPPPSFFLPHLFSLEFPPSLSHFEPAHKGKEGVEEWEKENEGGEDVRAGVRREICKRLISHLTEPPAPLPVLSFPYSSLSTVCSARPREKIGEGMKAGRVRKDEKKGLPPVLHFSPPAECKRRRHVCSWVSGEPAAASS